MPKAGDEVNQIIYFNDLMKWSKENKVIVFWFEAFDEPWKGTGTEGHWGIFSVSEKQNLLCMNIIRIWLRDEPTSPSYD